MLIVSPFPISHHGMVLGISGKGAQPRAVRMPTTKKLWRKAAGVPAASDACFKNEIVRALHQWPSVHSEYDGTQISYECTFRKTVPAGKHSKLTFHALVSINGLSGEQDIEVPRQHLKRGLPFPKHAYHDAC